jgi:antitoxin component of MazEF toxin-antitoxin module
LTLRKLFKWYQHNVYTMITKIKRWGNSFAVRLTRKELEEYGLEEGDEVQVRIEKVNPGKEVDLSKLPTFSEMNEKTSEDHDKYLYGDVTCG